MEEAVTVHGCLTVNSNCAPAIINRFAMDRSAILRGTGYIQNTVQ